MILSSPKGSSGSKERQKRGVGIERRRAFRVGVRSPDLEPLIKEVRCIAGVRPVEPMSLSRSRGPGSENRTRFLDFFGVTAAAVRLGALGAAVDSGTDRHVLCLVRWETGDELLELETELFRLFLPACLVSMLGKERGWSSTGESFSRKLGRVGI